MKSSIKCMDFLYYLFFHLIGYYRNKEKNLNNNKRQKVKKKCLCKILLRNFVKSTMMWRKVEEN